MAAKVIKDQKLHAVLDSFPTSKLTILAEFTDFEFLITLN